MNKNSVFHAYIVDVSKAAGLKNCITAQDLFSSIPSRVKLYDHVILSLIIGEKASEVIFGVKKSRYGLPDKQIIMCCLLEEANRLNVCFRENGTITSFVDYPVSTFGVCRCGYRPLYVATWLSQSQWVRLFLRYGASIYEDDICRCHANKAHVLVKIFTALTNNKFYNDFGAMSECFWLLTNELAPGRPLWREMLRWVPRMKRCMEDASSIPTLKHCTRYVIRSILREKKKLPFGIHELTLPDILKQYLSV
ncbi:uncharacterized protein [Centruroides vittatus]|uniref:uncharacterized protein n=1 Tax=Centruroides vittatus TaxID=120091 RepID=UPI00350E9851